MVGHKLFFSRSDNQVTTVCVQVVFFLADGSPGGGLGCRIAAVLIHFAYLSTFFWTNVMAWDIYKTFGQRTILSHIRPKGLHFPRYVAYGFGVPTIIVCICLCIDYSGFIRDFSMDYGETNCWIGKERDQIILNSFPNTRKDFL